LILLVDPKTMAWESIVNPGRDAGGGAGIRVAQILSERKVSDVISGKFGPNAQDALEAAGISMHRCRSNTTVREAIELLNAGNLPGAGVPSGGRRRWRRR
jgi:predicted Fe-Mo cluster-binding NifX family protein